ncbi:hypothetical protein [Streptomyces sp. NPDC050560]|uniref:hypothetical protein n=1 Tax=Streptomyces sp. NPDC050560 TaxID=3365630 RepID=UPI0037B3A832
MGGSRRTHQLLAVSRGLAVTVVALLLVTAGTWASWGPARRAMGADGGVRGTMTVASCHDGECTGPYTPSSAGSSPRSRVVLRQPVAADEGARVAVALRPGSDEVVRTGAAGLFRSWLPLGGALLLAAVIIAGGLRMPRTAWTAGVTGIALLTAAFVAL